MGTPHHLHAITLVLASAVTLGTTACNKDKDDDEDDGADDAAGESEDDGPDPSAGDDADPSAGDDADPSAGDDADPSAGDDDPSAGDDDAGESSDEESTDANDTGAGGDLRISGTASRSEAAAPFAGNDAVGDLYVVAFDDACGGNVVADAMVAAADLSDPASAVAFTVEGVGPGTYFVTGFLDDNGDYDPEAPGPNMGDIVMADGAMAGCIEVDVVDVDLEGAALLLNFTLPFDPP